MQTSPLNTPPIMPMEETLTQSNRLVFQCALLGGVLLWAAFPPLNLGWLGWVATIPWAALVLHPHAISARGYWFIWFAAWLHWALLLQGIRLAHPALYLGWLALSAYLAVYLPLFIGGSRTLIGVWKIPAYFAIPFVWVGLEYARAYIASGFSTASLSHTQVETPLVMQIASLGGAYAISFLMLLVTTSLALWWPAFQQTRWNCVTGTIFSVAAFVFTIVFGWRCLAHKPSVERSEVLRVLLVQGNIDTVLDHNPERPRQMFSHYRELTLGHLSEAKRDYDLIVWPESALAYPDFLADTDAQPEPRSGLSNAEFAENLRSYQAEQAEFYKQLLLEINSHTSGQTYLLAGTGTTEFGAQQSVSFNTAMLLSPAGKPIYRYYKNHLVMFGEYIPIVDWFPWIYQYTPMPGGLKPGREPGRFEIKSYPIGTSVCFESTVPHVIRQQALPTKQHREYPALHITVSNDGWFYGSAILDLHFQSAVMRAVEHGVPMLVAANTGISGVIDGYGRVSQRGPRHDTALLETKLNSISKSTLYVETIGDWPAFLCCWLTVLLGCYPFLSRKTGVEKVSPEQQLQSSHGSEHQQ
jgi:apolipoprotein N-acyltransferase